VCHSDASSPPPAAGAVPAESHGDLELDAADGNHFAAYVARAATPQRRGVVVMPDVRGLHAFYRDLAVRFAEIGVDAVAIDYFGRTAGIGDRSEDFVFRPHVDQMTPAGVTADVAAAAAYLRSPAGGSVTSVFTVGFCLGGGYSWRQSADTSGLAGAIGFYGRSTLAGDQVGAMTAPLLMLMGGADPHIPVEDAESFAAAVEQRGVPVELVAYPGAPHSFFDRTADDNAEACADSWLRIKAFMDRYSGTAQGT
jgi:carboxymethylenebutenolidase